VWNRARTRREVVVAGVAVVLLVAVASLAIATLVSSDARAADVSVTDGSCADGWHAPRSGVRTFSVRNDGRSAAEVELVGADKPQVYGSLEVVPPATSRALVVRIPPGRFQWKCDLASGVTLMSSAQKVSGRERRRVVAAEPVTADDLTPIATEVRDRTQTALESLAGETGALRAAVVAGRLDEAKTLWLRAHLDYERLGVAYGTFDDFDAKIDGRPEGQPRGTSDAHWTGFLRLERGLWGGEPLSALAPVAARLDDDVHALVAAFPDQFTDVRDIPLRAHEILENTLQFQLTGDADQGSHTVLATAEANVEGTESVLGALGPLLRSREPKLAAASQRALGSLGTLLATNRRADGTWLGLSDLTVPQREQLDSRFGSVLETLSPIPDVLELPSNPGQD
jgi:high-affinity iron transporter